MVKGACEAAQPHKHRSLNLMLSWPIDWNKNLFALFCFLVQYVVHWNVGPTYSTSSTAYLNIYVRACPLQ